MKWEWTEQITPAVGRKARFLPARIESTIRAKTLISDTIILGDAGTGKVDVMKALANLQVVCATLYNEVLRLRGLVDRNGASAPISVGV